MKLELTFIPAISNLAETIQDDECLVFTHVPKAAGTTLDRLLRGVGMVNKLPWRRAFGTVYDQFLGKGKREAIADFQEWPAELRHKVRIITGHVPYGIHVDMERSPRYVTLLREPVSRTVSHYKMGISRKGWSSDTSIEDVFKKGGLASDVQVRMLAGISSPEVEITDRILGQAIENLVSHYYLIGFSDTFDMFTSIVLGFLNAPNALLGTEQGGRVNLSPAQEQQIKESARKYNRWDALLYDEARSIAEAKIAKVLQPNVVGQSGTSKNTLLASSQVKIKNNEYSLIPPDQFNGVIENLKRSGVSIKGLVH